MKKLIIVTIVAAFFAACGEKPANESTTKATGLKTWVDSVSKIADADTMCNAESWTKWNSDYEAANAGINETELADADKTSYAATKETWAATGTRYTECMKKKEEAMKAAEMAKDTTAAMTPPAVPGDAKAAEPKK
jgi:hypothetical protein